MYKYVYISALLQLCFPSTQVDLSSPTSSDLSSPPSSLPYLFSERLGLVLEVSNPETVLNEYQTCNVPAVRIGKSHKHNKKVGTIASIIVEILLCMVRQYFDDCTVC